MSIRPGVNEMAGKAGSRIEMPTKKPLVGRRPVDSRGEHAKHVTVKNSELTD